MAAATLPEMWMRIVLGEGADAAGNQCAYQSTGQKAFEKWPPLC
jgi:hypothetical protein